MVEVVPITDPSQKNMVIAQDPPTGVLVSGHIILTVGKSPSPLNATGATYYSPAGAKGVRPALSRPSA